MTVVSISCLPRDASNATKLRSSAAESKSLRQIRRSNQTHSSALDDSIFYGVQKRASFVRRSSAESTRPRPKTAQDQHPVEEARKPTKKIDFADSTQRLNRAGKSISHEDRPPEREKRMVQDRMDDVMEKIRRREQARLADPEWAGRAHVIYDSSRRKSEKELKVGSSKLAGELAFKADFEGANLRRVSQIGPKEYDLVLMADTQTTRHMQWFYFQASGFRAGEDYTFNIVNLCKSRSLYNEGLRPLTYSKKRLAHRGLGWIRSCKNIAYYKSSLYYRKYSKIPFRTLTFTYTAEYNNDSVYFAHCYPYSAKQLSMEIDAVMSDPERMPFIDKTVIGKSPGGNDCVVLDITEFRSSISEMAERKGIIVTARCHPGETPSSFICRGVFKFLTGSSPEAQWLRQRYVFRVIPMLNPDGVVCGNTRCTLNGHDLNRCWDEPNEGHSPLGMFKDCLLSFKRERGVVLSIDLHAHSRRCNVFSYGCSPKSDFMSQGKTQENFERVFPKILSEECEAFQFQQCTFAQESSKSGTARIALHNDLDLRASYTIEASFLGGDVGVYEGRHYTSADYEIMGTEICVAIRKFCDQPRVEDILKDVELVRDNDLDADTTMNDSDYSSEGDSGDEALPEEIVPGQIERLQRLGRGQEVVMIPKAALSSHETKPKKDAIPKQGGGSKKRPSRAARPRTSMGLADRREINNTLSLVAVADTACAALSSTQPFDKKASPCISKDELDITSPFRNDVDSDGGFLPRTQSSPPEGSRASNAYFCGFGEEDDETVAMLARIKDLKSSMTAGATELEALQERIQRYDGFTKKMLKGSSPPHHRESLQAMGPVRVFQTTRPFL